MTMIKPRHLCAAAAATAVFINQQALAAGADSPLSGTYVLQVVGSLLLVFGCIFALFFLLRKVNGVSAGRGDDLRVIASARVGNREKIVLVQAGNQQLLVGVAPGNVRTLHLLEEPIEATNSFAEVLAKRSEGVTP